jgi:Zinc-binding dehydrogenase
VTGILVEPDRTGMEAIAALVEDGALQVRVAKTFPLDQAARAHRLTNARDRRAHPSGLDRKTWASDGCCIRDVMTSLNAQSSLSLMDQTLSAAVRHRLLKRRAARPAGLVRTGRAV